MPTNDEKRYYYEYEFELELIIPGEQDNIKPLRIQMVEKESDYVESFYPVLHILGSFDRKYMRKIYSKQLVTLVSIKQYSYKYLMTDSSSQARPDMVERKKILDSTFVPLFDPKSFPQDMRDEDYENDKSGKDGFNSHLMVHQIILDMVLYNVDDLATNKNALFNAVFKDCDVATALAYMVDNCNCKAAIIDKPDNGSKVGYMILLPYNLRNSIHSLQAHYGIYTGSLTAFMDFNCLYILHRYAKKHDYEATDKPYTFILLRDSITQSIEPPLITETNDTYKYVSSAVATKFDIRAITGEIQGNKVIFTNYKTALGVVQTNNGEVTGYNAAAIAVDRHTKGHEKSGMKVTFDYDELNNSFQFSSYLQDRTPREIVTIDIHGANAESFKPNKVFKLEFENQKRDQEMGGSYSLIYNQLIYTPVKPDSPRLVCNALMRLMSMKEK